ncbi:CTTNBP2 N-terminal-like protein [Acipenser ruthenus]|uniref:CTTNBP2 N-terminal-like protein n=1 Tax=Acipenser ruthenus TaxID=7906 RepID=UPI00145BF0AD|nr:CTTNBP2 N-terminal-like protein [Acipenser ruthenus]
MNMETLSKAELLMLFSVLEGELEARDLVIEALRAQQRELFIQKRYGKYNVSDPFLALQRDYETIPKDRREEERAACPNPLSVLKLVMSHCKTMQEKMLSQLAAAESRHRKVIVDLEEERHRHAQDSAEGDDVTYMLEKDRERLLQQLDFEKSQVKKLEKEQKKHWVQLEEERAQHKQLSKALTKECKQAKAKAAEEEKTAAELVQVLEREKSTVHQREEELQAERKRGLHMEAQAEKQLSEFDTEREQLRARLKREESRTRGLEEEVEQLKKALAELQSAGQALQETHNLVSVATGFDCVDLISTTCQTESSRMETTGGPSESTSPAATKPSALPAPHSRVNGHCSSATLKANDLPAGSETDPQDKAFVNQENGLENGSSSGIHSPAQVASQLLMSVSPSSTASSSLTSSPCSSPVLTKRLGGIPAGSPGYQSSYQAGINQRFHAARHKFQAQSEQDGAPHSPRDLSPTAVDNTAAKQMARNTVTQVLSRFTNQSGKPTSPNSSPFGTDYRTLASSSSPKGESSHSSPLSPLSPGIKSPTMPRSERGNPPPIPPKKPGLSQSPASPNPSTKSSSPTSQLVSTADLPNSCCLNSSMVEMGKDLDLMMPTSS